MKNRKIDFFVDNKYYFSSNSYQSIEHAKDLLSCKEFVFIYGFGKVCVNDITMKYAKKG